MRIARARQRAADPAAARFIADDMIEDTLERLAFLRHTPSRALVLGEWTGTLAAALHRSDAMVAAPAELDLEAPHPVGDFDLIVVMGLLDAVNDLPGALIHLRAALSPGGLIIAHFIGGQSLPALRAAMFAAEPDRPAARIHPLVVPRAAPGLLPRPQMKDDLPDPPDLEEELDMAQAPRKGGAPMVASSSGFPGRTPIEIGLPPPPPGQGRTRVAQNQSGPISPLAAHPLVAPPARLAPMTSLDDLMSREGLLPFAPLRR
jgi:SAM-dependent methyltransferase